MAQRACDHFSVGLFLRSDDKIAVIFKKTIPQAYALPTWHLDGRPFYDAAIEDAHKKLNLVVKEQILIHKGDFQNPCRRTGTAFHAWRVFRPLVWDGILCANSDTFEAVWMGIPELREKAHMTRAIAQQLKISMQDVGSATFLIMSHPWWRKYPGLEPVWYVILDRMGLLYAPLPAP